ncbi:uncharacterized protein LOC135213400 [Macrobrachium nipponense]|uniref:uncharacterized protein LOC135213400 n=1 Tax=Macrobrachium nipponense TaxID=159736 RepID=UPI0030C891BB
MMDYFGFPLLLANLTMPLGITYLLYFQIDSYLTDGAFDWMVFIMIPAMMAHFVLIQTESDALNENKRKDALILQRYVSADPYLRESVTVYRVLNTLQKRTDFSLIGFFSLGRSCLTTAAGFILSYLVIVLQFRGIKMASVG